MIITVACGDSVELLRARTGPLFDAVVTDPPYHLTSIVERFGKADAALAQYGTDGAFARASRGFMGQEWDGGDVAFRPDTWRAILDQMKPGAHLAAFSGTRTYHRMAVAIEDAGFEIRDQLAWVYGSGMPKSAGLKPAWEPICLARKPCEGTRKANIAAHGTGGLQVDACRIGSEIVGWGGARGGSDASGQSQGRNYRMGAGVARPVEGRWPANILHDGSDEVLAGFPLAKAGSSVSGNEASVPLGGTVFGKGMARVPSASYADEGSAARFFYSAKAGPLDRLGSEHPTVKPVDLMRWLCRLVTPPGGLILDPFAGSGTTGIAAIAEGFSAELIDLMPEHVADIEAKLAHLRGKGARIVERHLRRKTDRAPKPENTLL